MAELVVRHLGCCHYLPIWHAMQNFTSRRDKQTRDEIWMLEHTAVYTLGLNGKPEHIIDPGGIPVVQVDRGGQVTYHGPGQLIVYVLLDLQRLHLGIRALVSTLEDAVIDVLSAYGIQGQSRREAPGVYVASRKIASVGLRVRRGCCFHGLSLNTALDLEPFRRIHPCGYPDLEVTQLSGEGGPSELSVVAGELLRHLIRRLNINHWATEHNLSADLLAMLTPTMSH
jgi:lipoyl(octanoyl) transferase